jgi:isoleucyl-tRNA synthetase
MDKNYEADSLRVFGRFVEAGLVSWKLKTVPWCSSCQTTLSKSEMEYLPRLDPSLYLRFDLTPDSLSRLSTLLPGVELDRVSLVAWTTTPWTLPFNKAVVLSPKGEYVLAKRAPSSSPGAASPAPVASSPEGLLVVGKAEFPSLKRLLKLAGKKKIT